MSAKRFADMQDDDPYAKRHLGPLDVRGPETFRGRLVEPADIKRFIEAGNATITLVSMKSGSRFTYKFVRPDEEQGKQQPLWVRLLSGPDNESDYSFIGTTWPPKHELRFGRSSRVTEQAPSSQALQWFLAALYTRPDLLKYCEVWHEGRCGRCGRKLTVPESVKSGFGPECSARLAHPGGRF